MGFKDLERKLRKVADITPDIASEASDQINEMLQHEFTGADWIPLKTQSIRRRGHSKPALVDTEALKSSLQVRPVVYKGSIDIRITLDWYMVFHEKERPIIADQDKLEKIIGQSISKVFGQIR